MCSAHPTRDHIVNRRNLLMTAGAGIALTVAANETRANTTPSQSPTRLDMQTIKTNDGTRLYIKEWGTGAPVVFVHSWALNSDMWQYQTAEFADHGLRCITYDRRGHGRSDQPGSGYDTDTLADDLAMVMDSLDVSNATLVGHSMGCGEIVRYLVAARRQARRAHRAARADDAVPEADAGQSGRHSRAGIRSACAPPGVPTFRNGWQTTRRRSSRKRRPARCSSGAPR